MECMRELRAVRCSKAARLQVTLVRLVVFSIALDPMNEGSVLMEVMDCSHITENSGNEFTKNAMIEIDMP